MATRYVVTGEYITVRTGTPDGPRVVGLMRGALVPEDVSEESIQHHLRKGLMAEADATGAVAADVAEGTESASVVERPQPPRAASKAEWVEYAVSQGADREEAEGSTKDDLVATYG